MFFAPLHRMYHDAVEETEIPPRCSNLIKAHFSVSISDVFQNQAHITGALRSERDKTVTVIVPATQMKRIRANILA